MPCQCFCLEQSNGYSGFTFDSFNSTVVCSLLTSTFHSTNGSFYYRVALKGGPSLPRCMNSPVWHLLMRPCTIRSACAVKVPRESVQERARVHLSSFPLAPISNALHSPTRRGRTKSIYACEGERSSFTWNAASFSDGHIQYAVV